MLGKACFQEICVQKKIGVILDCTILFEQKTVNLNIDQLSNLVLPTRRLLHNLSGVRYRTLKTLPKKGARAGVK